MITGQQIRNALKATNYDFRSPRGDDLTHFVELELEQALSQAFDIEYGLLRGAEFVEFDNSLAPWAESWARMYFDEAGQAKLGSTMQDDAPRVDVIKTKDTHSTVVISASYGWNLLELQRAAATGLPLDTRKQQAVIRAINRKIDELVISGDASIGFTGLANDANVTLTDPPPGGAWSGFTTGQEFMNSLLGMELAVNNTTLDVRPPDTIVLPPTGFTRVHAAYGLDSATSIISSFLSQARWIRRVEQWQELETAGTGGADRAIVYNSAADTVNFKVGTLATFLPPQARNFEFVVPVYAVVGGVEFARPAAARYYENV